MLASLALLAPATAQAQQGVHVDPSSPAGKEYAIPLDQARRQAGGAHSAGGASGRPTLFGAGVTPASKHQPGSASPSPGSLNHPGGAGSSPLPAAASGGPASIVLSGHPAGGGAGGGSGPTLAIVGGGLIVLLGGGLAGLFLRRAD